MRAALSLGAEQPDDGGVVFGQDAVELLADTELVEVEAVALEAVGWGVNLPEVGLAKAAVGAVVVALRHVANPRAGVCQRIGGGVLAGQRRAREREAIAFVGPAAAQRGIAVEPVAGAEGELLEAGAPGEHVLSVVGPAASGHVKAREVELGEARAAKEHAAETAVSLIRG